MWWRPLCRRRRAVACVAGCFETRSCWVSSTTTTALPGVVSHSRPSSRSHTPPSTPCRSRVIDSQAQPVDGTAPWCVGVVACRHGVAASVVVCWELWRVSAMVCLFCRVYAWTSAVALRGGSTSQISSVSCATLAPVFVSGLCRGIRLQPVHYCCVAVASVLLPHSAPSTACWRGAHCRRGGSGGVFGLGYSFVSA